MNVGLQTQFDVSEVHFYFLSRLHLPYHIVKYLDLINADLDAIGELVRGLVRLLEPGV